MSNAVIELFGKFDRAGATDFYFDVRDTAHWLSWGCSMSPGTAREHVRVSRALPPPPGSARAVRGRGARLLQGARGHPNRRHGAGRGVGHDGQEHDGRSVGPLGQRLPLRRRVQARARHADPELDPRALGGGTWQHPTRCMGSHVSISGSLGSVTPLGHVHPHRNGAARFSRQNVLVGTLHTPWTDPQLGSFSTGCWRREISAQLGHISSNSRHDRYEGPPSR